MQHLPHAVVSLVPIRHSQWASILMGALAALLSVALGGAVVGLLVLAWPSIDGALALLVGAGAAFGGFFGSISLQRRASRAWHARRPGVILDRDRLEVALPAQPITIQHSRPYAIAIGWVDEVAGSGASRTRNRLSFAIVTQGTVQIMFVADDSLRAARRVGWPRATWPTWSGLRVRLWSADLVALIEELRAMSRASIV